ncbi:MAG: hypothetical protein QW165_02425 [Candidatus Woesearchaeota archaeon]
MIFSGIINFSKKTETPENDAMRVLEFVDKKLALSCEVKIKDENKKHFQTLLKLQHAGNLLFNAKPIRDIRTSVNTISLSYDESTIRGNTLRISMDIAHATDESLNNILLFFEQFAETFGDINAYLDFSGREGTEAEYWKGVYERDENLLLSFDVIEAQKKKILGGKVFALFHNKISFTDDSQIIKYAEQKKRMNLKEMGTGKESTTVALFVSNECKDGSQEVLIYIGYGHVYGLQCMWVKGKNHDEAVENARTALRHIGLELVGIKNE